MLKKVELGCGQAGTPILLIAVLLFFAGVSRASDFVIDPLAFKSQEGRVYIELHLDLPRAALQHQKETDGWYGAVRFSVSIAKDSLTVARDDWMVEDLAENETALSTSQRIVDARVYEATPGDYTFIAFAIDSISGKSWTVNKGYRVEPFPDDQLTMSDIQLSNYLLPAGIHPRFDRGNVTMIPNPSRLFGLPGPIYYFFEIYPPVADTATRDYDIHRWVLDAYGRTVTTLPKNVISGGTPFLDVDSISIAELPGGYYFFKVQVESPAGMNALRQTRFKVVRTDTLAMLHEDVDSARYCAEFEQVEFLLNRDQLEIGRKFTPWQKKYFLNAFWRRFDNDTTDAVVPLRESFQSRVNEADALYSNSRTPGHRTDRGRIFSMFGEPDDRDSHPLDQHAKPYEIWTYRHIEGGVEFAFVDRSGLGEYALVHSTLRGEVSNPDWYNFYVVRSGLETRK